MARDALLSQIHIGRAALGLEDDDYRAMLLRITGHRTSAGLSTAKKRAVVEELKRLGWQGGTAKSRKVSKKPFVRLVFALWGELKREGIWRNPEIASLRAFIKKMTGVDDPEFLTWSQASVVIEAMKAMKAMKKERAK